MTAFEFLAMIILILSVAGVIVIDRLFGNRRASQHQILLAEQHAHQLTERVNELERHNDELRQQLEWNRRLLEAQDRLLQQLGPAPTHEPLPPASSGLRPHARA